MWKNRSHIKKVLHLLTLLIIFFGVIFDIGIWRIFRLKNSKILIEKEIIFKLKASTGRFTLSQQLYTLKVIKHPHILQWLMRLEPELSHFNAGTYRFTPGMSVYELLDLLKRGKEAQFSLRFIEGMRLSDYLKQLRKEIYIRHTLKNDKYDTVAKSLNLKHSDQIEGHFWPDTWLYTADMTDVSILRRAYNKMMIQIEKSWKDRDKGLPYSDQNQFVTMASIIEKETAIECERRKIASVFINRLRIGMKLQTDTTVIYGMGSHFSGQISKKDLEMPTVYNTYIINGLPPGPISTPSQASLNAAAHPDKTPYLYFVADGRGGHIFNTDLVSHNRSVKQYLKVLTEKNAR